MKTSGILSAFLVLLLGLSCPVGLKADERGGAQKEKLDSLLAGYLQNSLAVKKSMLTAKSKSLDLKSSQINNGITVSLSTGEMKILASSDSTKITVTPQANVSATEFSDSSLSVSIPVTIQDGEKSVSDGTVSLSVGIISGKSKERQAELLEAERASLEAERAVLDAALTAEKEFYENLKKLYTAAVAVLNAKGELYDDAMNLRLLLTQGYSKSSSQYRAADLSVQSDRRSVLEKQRVLERETMIFARKCGVSYEKDSAEDDPVKAGEKSFFAVLAFLPSEIPAVEPENLENYPLEKYSTFESAEWNKKINELKREADYDMTLYAAGEYIFNDSFTNSDVFGAKLTWAWKGLSASAGAYMPTGTNLLGSDGKLEKSESPYFALSLGFTPNTWRLSKIEKAQDELERQIEDVEIESAKDSYETDILDKSSSYSDIAWNKISYAEEADMYENLEKDMARYFKQGYVTENDYLDAKNNKEIAELNMLINAVELVICNAETKLLFVRNGD
ncbi:hypothetical protein [Treponema zioleckii]|uniref:hypothetical protein n=1 Tax=Treponema zioleckii TaxID=331680 RepID=UPI00168B593E|nr:hypothetical protein [Treponema zioleckii]